MTQHTQNVHKMTRRQSFAAHSVVFPLMAGLLCLAGCAQPLSLVKSTTYDGRTALLGDAAPQHNFTTNDMVGVTAFITWPDVTHDAGTHNIAWNWYRGTQLVSHTEAHRPLTFKTAPVTLSARAPAASLGAGTYHADLLIDGQVMASEPFSITDVSTSRQALTLVNAVTTTADGDKSTLPYANHTPRHDFTTNDAIAVITYVTWADVSQGAGSHALGWRWYRDGQLVSSFDSDRPQIFKEAPGHIWTRRAAASLGTGNFRVDTLVDGQVISSQQFTIK